MKYLLLVLLYSINTSAQQPFEQREELVKNIKPIADSFQKVTDANKSLKILNDTTPIFTSLDDNHIQYKVTSYYYNSDNALQKVLTNGTQGPISFYYLNGALTLVQIEVFERI